MIIQHKRNLTIHNNIDDAKKYLQKYVLNNPTNLKEGEILNTRYKSVGGETYNLTATLYTNTAGILYCVFDETAQQLPNLDGEFNTTSESDIVEVYVSFYNSRTIRNTLLGAGMKEPYNFVMKYNGGSYDPSYNISDANTRFCQMVNKNMFCIIESMDYPNWLHNCNIDLTNFNGVSDGIIVLKDVFIPTALYCHTDDYKTDPSMIHSFLRQFVNGFKYYTNGSIIKTKVHIEGHSHTDLNANSITYRLPPNSNQFFDSTLFFNKAMQGKYMPFMWDGKLKYFHFNHELN